MEQSQNRRGPPQPKEREVLRRRLVDRLDERWRRRVVCVVAPAGFGKTTAIAQAMRENEVAPRGVDVWVPCEIGDGSVGQLAAAVGEALGLTRDQTSLERILDELKRRSPTPTSLVLDDVHLLESDSDGASLLADLVRRLPANTHLVLASRVEPPLPLARLRAHGEVITITQQELRLESEELEQLGAPADEGHGGWAALVSLGLESGPPGSVEDFVHEEVLPDLDEAALEALLVAVVAGTLDERLWRDISAVDESLERLLAGVPLLTWDSEGRVTAHDLWREILRGRLREPQVLALSRDVALAVLARDDWERAFSIAVQAGDWAAVAEVVVAAVVRRQNFALGPLASSWLDELKSDWRSEPEAMLLEAIALGAQNRQDPETDALLDSAMEAFASAGNADGELLVMSVRLTLAWERGDQAEVSRLSARIHELDTGPHVALAAMIHIADAVASDLSGDLEAATSALLSLPLDQASSGTRHLTARWLASLLTVEGRSDEAIGQAEVAFQHRPGGFTANVLGLTLWFGGDPSMVMEDLLGEGPDPSPERQRDRFSNQVYSRVAAASLGNPVSDMEGSSTDGREATLMAVARIAAAVQRGDEPEATEIAADVVDRFPPLEDGRAAGEVRRFLPYFYVLSDQARQYLDEAELGPTHQATRELARALLAGRRGRKCEVPPSVGPERIVTAFPFAWSVEIGCHLGDGGGPLLSWLIHEADGPVRQTLELLAARDNPANRQAKDLLKQVPIRPESTVSLRLLGPLAMERDGAADDSGEWRRSRVRELIAVLVLHGPTGRERVADMLWPELPPDASANNLRLTLARARRLLEPDRPRSAPSFCLRQDGESLVLVGPPVIDTDVWQFRNLFELGQRADAAGNVAQAAASFVAATELIDGDPLPGLEGEWTEEFRRSIRADAVAAAARAGELRLAEREHAAATSLGEMAIGLDPYNERAHRLVVAAAASRGDSLAAMQALQRCQELLEELGATPAPETTMLARLVEPADQG